MSQTPPIAVAFGPKLGFARPLFSHAASLLAVRLTGIFLAALFNLYIAWSFDARAVGYFMTSLAVVTILSILLRCGLDLLVLRKVSCSAADEDMSAVKALMRAALAFVALVSTAITAALWVGVPLVLGHLPKDALHMFLTLSLALPFISVLNIMTEGLKGVGKQRDAVFVLSVVPPGYALVLLAPLTAFLGLPGLGVNIALSMLFGALLAHRFLMVPMLGRPVPVSRTPRIGDLLKQARSYWVLMTVNRALLPWALFPVLALLGTAEEAGHFGIASRFALLVGLPLACIEMLLGPKFARLHKEGNLSALRRQCQLGAMTAVLATSPAVFLLLAPEKAMWIFGTEYLAAGPVLAVLILGQFANAALGSVGLCLTMTGRGQDAAKASVVSLGVLLIMAIWLVPELGAVGAAWATASAQLVNRLVASVLVYRALGFTIFTIRYKDA